MLFIGCCLGQASNLTFTMSVLFPIEIPEGCEFGYHNIPFGIFSVASENSPKVSNFVCVLNHAMENSAEYLMRMHLHSLTVEDVLQSGITFSISASLSAMGYSARLI
jgi:hypothetical protein